MGDCKAKVLITASGVMRGNKKIDLKAIADSAHAMCAKAGHTVPRVVVYENERCARARPCLLCCLMSTTVFQGHHRVYT
jgi:acetyl-CoA synthetase